MNILITTSKFSINTFPEGLNIITNPFKRKLTEEEVIDLILKYQPVGMIAGVEPLTRKVFEKASKLKIISRCGIGMDSVDLEAAKEFGIKVTNTPESPTVSVAEHTLAMILCLLKKINVLDSGIREGKWGGPQGWLLSGKTSGIIGCGRIGTYVSRLLAGFGCKVIGYDPYIKKHDICTLAPLEEIIKQADILTLHIPYTKENHHIIGEKEINMMKPGTVIINVARGGIIDETALYKALETRKIAGAALDCFESEPYGGPLIQLENTLLSPHMGSSAIEARVAMEKEAVDNFLTQLKEQGMI